MPEERVFYFVLGGISHEGECPIGVVESSEEVVGIAAQELAGGTRHGNGGGGYNWITGCKLVVSDTGIRWDVDSDIDIREDKEPK